jgi:hypothetical protein
MACGGCGKKVRKFRASCDVRRLKPVRRNYARLCRPCPATRDSLARAATSPAWRLRLTAPPSPGHARRVLCWAARVASAEPLGHRPPPPAPPPSPRRPSSSLARATPTKPLGRRGPHIPIGLLLHRPWPLATPCRPPQPPPAADPCLATWQAWKGEEEVLGRRIRMK